MDVTAGWYPDPEDAANLRWWDGSAWTDHRQPIGQPGPDQATPEASDDAGTADVTSAETAPVDEPAAPADEPAEATGEATGDATGPTPGEPEPVPAPDPTVTDAPAVEPAPPWAPTPPFETAEPTAAMAAVPPPPPPPPPPLTPEAAPTPAATGGEGGSGKRKPLLIGLGVVAVIALGVGAFLFFGGDDGAEYTWDGESIAQLDETLADADDTFLAGVEERNGAVTDDSRCYLVQSADEDAERSSDLLDFLRCGPVLFVDDDPGDGVWITYALSADENDDGDLVLTSAEAPQSNEPSRYDDDEEILSRPDGETPPDGNGGIETPDPPRAEAGLLLSGDPVLDDIEMQSAFVLAVGLTKSVDLVGTAEPSRFGSGDAARRPADGERFIAFEVRIGQGDDRYGTPADQASAAASSAATISVDVDGETTVIAEGDDEDYDLRHLVSVPEDADVVDLVLVDSDVTQRISLLTQEPSADNIAVLARTTRDVELGNAQAFPVTITHPDGAVQQDTFTVTVENAELLYYVDDVPDRVPSSPDKAFLVIHHFVTSEVTGITAEDDIGLEPGHMHLDLGGGTIVPSVNLAPTDGDILLAFEVPGTYDQGTLQIRGAAVSAGIDIDLGEPGFNIPIIIDGV